MRICIHGRVFSREIQIFLEKLKERTTDDHIDLYISPIYFQLIEQSAEYHSRISIPVNSGTEVMDYYFSIGGDGTLLETVLLAGPSEVPILGINTGRLGFLTSTSLHFFDEVYKKLKNGSYTIDSRALIRIDFPGNPFNAQNFALNEVGILKSDSSSMINVHTSINDEFLNSYWADGLIISTPTGSTGYSLSCGGPVVMPGSENFIITPVSPHNLSVRPIIVSDNSRIILSVESRSGHFLVSLDSRSQPIFQKQKLQIKKESFKAKLVKFDDYNYFETLRKKLNWGADIRN